ncbi:DNA alkylation repair protein [Empedobacter falsenii]|uniref:DNA alkylation repair enzyme n=1 Tax=Empedobacter falsenii TaxID=343874 RepID=A0A376G5A5_9FLAO|nr:DNA alkylation repair protein [Empedobacter falsenii]STD55865.1 DNA alkylation repair enzyme [Empedobacter falsenii]
MIKRKGARSTKDIPTAILASLNRGEIETANLVEWLAVDQRLLLKNLLKENQRTVYLNPILNKIEQLKKQTVNTINEVIGTELLQLVNQNNDNELLHLLSNHTSDLVRCWATYLIGKNETLSITETLNQIQPFAADKHFGVREISWMSVRNKIASDIEKSIVILSKWTSNNDENIRRFSTEATRPRGVWCEHIIELKNNPKLALSILEPLKSDTSKYVQDSVGNWLNDASKSNPVFVAEFCKNWEKESDTKETKYIIKKALRTINKI